MVDWNQFRPNWRDAFDVGAGVFIDRFVIKRVQQYLQDSMHNAIKNAMSDVYAQQQTERSDLYKKIDSLTYELAELKKKVGTSA